MQLSTPLVSAALALALLAPAADAQAPNKEHRHAVDHEWGGEQAFAGREGTPASAILINPDGSQGDVISYIDYDGVAIYGGDMVLHVDEHGYAAFQRDLLDTRDTKAAGRTTSSRMWAGAIVPYTIDGGVSSTVRGWITTAIAEWQGLTQIRFVPRSDQADYLYFTAESFCKSSVGRQGGMQKIWVTGCDKMGSVIHEIGHAVGLYHEHTRADRDSHVTINWSNIKSEYFDNFEQYTAADAVDLGNYDFGSIMHYSCTAGRISSGLQTITPISNPSLCNSIIGQRDGLSDGDVDGINELYPPVTMMAMNYSGTNGQGKTIYQIDPQNGRTSQSRSIWWASCVSDMDFVPGSSSMYGVDCSDTANGAGSTILQIRTSDGAAMPYVSLGSRKATSIAMDPDNPLTLYAIDQQGKGWGRTLFKVDLLWRRVTEIGTLSGSRTQATSIAFSEDGTLYAIDNTYNNGAGAVLFTINKSTAQTSTIGWMRGDRTHATSIRFGAGGTLYAINNSANGKGKVLFMIDTEDARTTDIATLSGEQRWATALAVYY